MKKRVLLLLLSAVVAIFCRTAQAQVIIIANPSVKATEVSASDLRDIFDGASTSLKGSAAVPVLLKQGAAHDEFLARYIGKSDSAFRASWRSMIFSGQGAMPWTLDSESAVIEYVEHTPGAIAYISKSTPHAGVKTLTVR